MEISSLSEEKALKPFKLLEKISKIPYRTIFKVRDHSKETFALRFISVCQDQNAD
jgi:hypothetical protein